MPELKDFIRRAAVLAKYRALLRAAKAMGRARPHEALEVEEQIRAEFRRHVDADHLTAKRLLAQGERHLEILRAVAAVPEQADEDRVVGQGWPWERESR